MSTAPQWLDSLRDVVSEMHAAAKDGDPVASHAAMVCAGLYLIVSAGHDPEKAGTFLIALSRAVRKIADNCTPEL
jgi:hypothetical protein